MFDKKPFSRKGNYQRKSEPPKPYKARRGKLAPLLSDEAKTTGNIQGLSYDFACRIIRLYQYLTEPINGERCTINDDDNHQSSIINPSSAHEREFIMSKQVLRSGTSIGANVREANHAQSEADFLNKMNIALKEADETDYWLNLLLDNGYLTDGQYESLNHDSTRILRCLTSIVKTMKSKTGKQK